MSVHVTDSIEYNEKTFIFSKEAMWDREQTSDVTQYYRQLPRFVIRIKRSNTDIHWKKNYLHHKNADCLSI